MAYSYQDFLNSFNGLSPELQSQFSQYDKDLAQKYPDFGMSLVSAKQAWATSDAATQQQLRDSIEQQRMSLGGYSGGADGSLYLQTNPRQGQINDGIDRIGSFGSFDYGQSAPTFNSQWSGQQEQLMNSLLNRPDYNNQYAQHQRDLLDAILNRPEFSYNKEDDPQWASYAKSHRREGERATANALAQASRASGGIPSSYAVTAASQAGDYYAAKLNDIIPQLYQQAYQRYLNEFQMKHQNLGMVNNMEQMDYRKYLDDFNMGHQNLGALGNLHNQDFMQYQSELGQFNTNREFSYKNYLNDYYMLNNHLSVLQGQDATDYTRYLDSIAQRQEEQRYWDETNNNRSMDDRNWHFDLLNQFGSVMTPEQAALFGVPMGTPTASQAWQQWQMEQPAARAVSGGGGTSTQSGNNDSGSEALNAFSAGNHSDAVIQALLSMGYSQADIIGAGYKGNYFNNASQGASQGASQINWNSVNALGYGPINENQLWRLVENGQVIADELPNGSIYFSLPSAPRTGGGLYRPIAEVR